LPEWLQRFKKNDIIETIQAVGLDPKDFDRENGAVEVRIKHRWSASCFTIGGYLTRFVGRDVVGDVWDMPFEAYSWPTVMQRMRGWLNYVKIYHNTRDLWAELERDGQLLLGATFDEVTDNTPFTADEQNEIAARLQELAEDARRTYSLSAEQMRALEAKVDYLITATRRLGRKDWLNVCAGTILGYILNASLPPEAARGMFLGLLRVIGHLCGLPDLPMLTC
jgi:hypothetical protein